MDEKHLKSSCRASIYKLQLNKQRKLTTLHTFLRHFVFRGRRALFSKNTIDAHAG